MSLPAVDVPLPDVPPDRVRAGGADDADAVGEIGTAFFGVWPLGPGTARAAADRLLDSPLGHHVRAYFPYELDDAAVIGALQRIADQFASRLLKRWKPDRGSFHDWVRLNTEDLALQEAVHVYQQGADRVRDALAAVDGAIGDGDEAKDDPLRWAELAQSSAAGLAPLRDAWAAWQPVRQAVCGLVWQSFFFADPDGNGDGFRLSHAASWIHNLKRRQGADAPLAEAEELAQEFYLYKVLERDLLLRFKPELGASFIQWLRISVENYTRDHLAKPPTPEEVAFSDALAGSLASGGQVITRTSGAGGEDDEGGGPGGESGTSGEREPDPFGDTATIGGAATFEAGEERLSLVLHHIMPALLADPFHRTFARLFLGLPLIREDFELIARQRLVQWAAELAVERLDGPARESDDESATAAATTDEQFEDVRTLAIRDRFLAHCRQMGAGATATGASGRLPKRLTAAQREQVVAWFRGQLSPALRSLGRRARIPELPKTLQADGASRAVHDLAERLQKILMAIEHAPGSGGEPGIFAALVAALDDLMTEIERSFSVQEKEFQQDALRSISQNRLRIKRLEARLRNLPAGSEEANQAEEKLARMRRSIQTRAQELQRKSFGLRDADIGRLLGMDPKTVPSLKTRVRKNLTDFRNANELSEARVALLGTMKRGKKARLDRYDAGLEALATFSMFPANEGAQKRLHDATDGRLDAAAANRLRELLATIRRNGTGRPDATQAAERELADLQGRLLGRDDLVRLGADAAAVERYEGTSLRILPGVIWLRQLGLAE